MPSKEDLHVGPNLGSCRMVGLGHTYSEHSICILTHRDTNTNEVLKKTRCRVLTLSGYREYGDFLILLECKGLLFCM